MALFLTTLTGLASIYGGTAGVELLLRRYATPEARAVQVRSVKNTEPGETSSSEAGRN